MMIIIATVVDKALCSGELGTGLLTVYSVTQTSHACWVLAKLP